MDTEMTERVERLTKLNEMNKPTIKQLRECANVRWEYNKGFILNKERVCKTLDILGRNFLRVVCSMIPHEFYGY
jgi:hypothetical protein